MAHELIESPTADTGAYQICGRCVMDSSATDITFDDSGECHYCRIYDERNAKERFPGAAGQELLDSYVSTIKAHGRGHDYDCIVGVSGGVDSTTVAYTARQLGLRPLAVHLDNGWDSELAVDNISKTLRTLDIDLFTHVIDWEEFRELQLAFLRASVPNAEIPTDHAINAILYRAAADHGIRYILGGGNIQTEAFMPPEWVYDCRDLKHLRSIHRRFGTGGKLTTFPTISLPGCVREVVVRRTRILPILNYIDYHKADAKQTIQAELGWRDYGGKHHESVYTRFFQGHILPVKFGYDKRRVHLSNLILSGEISREAALAELERDPYDPKALEHDRSFVIKKLGLTDESFGEIMALPTKSHWDYPGHHKVFRGMDSYRQAFKKFAMKI